MDGKPRGMKKEITILAALIAVLLVAFLLIGQMGGNTMPIIDSPPNQENSEGLAIGSAAKQENSEGPVTIAIQYLDSKDAKNRDSLAFQVTITTHSVNLDQYDIDKLAVLKDAQGNVYSPSKWIEDQGSGGHHRSGILYFDRADKAGNDIIDSNDKIFEVEVNEIGDVSVRSFKWGL